MTYKIGSLFDGSGGFPLSASMCGIVPTWASEVEPYPIAVTWIRFPGMKHLGDVRKINGAEIEPVDVITFGSPCQDLSIAGKRAGIRDGTRSGLFLEAIRIIKEMRESTGGKYPTFALWENVPGAFSSNNGEDFRTVLQEFVKIKEPSAVMPPVPGGGWAYADCYMGDGWSLAYRTLDAQYWGVPQRRRRIYLVADFRGKCAGEILFKRKGLRGYFAESRTPREGIAADDERGTDADDRNAGCLNPWDNQSKRIFPPDAQYQTLYAAEKGGGQLHGVCIPINTMIATREKTPTLASEAGGNSVPSVCVAYDARGNGDGVIVNTITGDHENRITDYTTVICLQGNGIDRSIGQNGLGVGENVSYTLDAVDRHGVVYAVQGFGDYKKYMTGSTLRAAHDITTSDLIVMNDNKVQRYIVRRLTPTEYARLQGFPDKWGHPDHKDDFTNEECRFWLDVRNTHAAINGKAERQYTKEQMLTWYNRLHTDSAEYKMWGNGIALPTALYVMQGIADALQIGGIKE